MKLHGVPALFVVCSGLAQAQVYSLAGIQVSGNQRFTAAAVIAASGLRVGQSFTAKDVEAAAHRLADTGLFASVDHDYVPKTVNRKTGYVLKWQIHEAPISASVRLDFPGIDEQQLWKELTSANALLDGQIPSNALVVEYYRLNIEKVLRKRRRNDQIVAKNEANLITRKFSVVFRPADIP